MNTKRWFLAFAACFISAVTGGWVGLIAMVGVLIFITIWEKLDENHK